MNNKDNNELNVNINNTKKTSNDSKSSGESSFPIVISIVMAILFILFGSIWVLVGLNDLYKTNVKYKDYIKVNAVLSNYEGDYDSDGNYLYTSIYTYVIDKVPYNVESKLYQAHKPKIGTVVEVKYNPQNVEEVVFVNDASTSFSLFLGIFFIFVPIFIFFYNVFSGREKAQHILTGLFMFLLGFGLLWVLGFSDNTSFSIAVIIEKLNVLVIIPLFFLVLGLFGIIQAIVTPSKKFEEKVVQQQKEQIIRHEKIVTSPHFIKGQIGLNKLYLFIIYFLIFNFLFRCLTISSPTINGLVIPVIILLVIYLISDIIKILINFRIVNSISIRRKLENILFSLKKFTGAIMLCFLSVGFFNIYYYSDDYLYLVISLILFSIVIFQFRKELKK